MALDLMGAARADFPIAYREDVQSWLDVADDAGWDPYRGIGGWSFLDAVGVRLPRGGYVPHGSDRQGRRYRSIDKSLVQRQAKTPFH